MQERLQQQWCPSVLEPQQIGLLLALLLRWARIDLASTSLPDELHGSTVVESQHLGQIRTERRQQPHGIELGLASMSLKLGFHLRS